jgi:glyoxylase I family protein
MKLEHVAINVEDSVAMAEWYVKNCKMKIVLQVDGPPYTRFLTDAEGRTAIEIYSNPAAATPDYARQHPLIYHHAFVVDDLEGVKSRLMEEGATFVEEVNLDTGARLIMLRDPWGIPLQLVHRPKAQTWY